MTLVALASLGSTYERINRGVHRKAASLVGVPSIIRHLGLWYAGNSPAAAPAETSPPDPAGPFPSTPPGSREQAFVDYLAALSSIIGDETSKSIHFDRKDPTRPAADELRSELPAVDDVRSGTIVMFRFWWHGMRATIRIEYRTEYVMVTSIIDLSIRPDPRYETFKDDPQQSARIRLRRISALFNHKPAEDDPAAPGQPGAELAGCESVDPGEVDHCDTAQFLQYRIWKLFEDSVLDAPKDGEGILGTNLGQVFADFRGIVTGSTAGERGNETGAPEDRIFVHQFREPFKNEPLEQRTRKLEHRSPPAGWHRDSLKRLWPVIECEDYLHEHEFTVSGFLNGRALFLTALGPKPPDGFQCGWAWTPVCNFIHSFTDDEWQLGRLIDRIKYLGTLRLAATVQIEQLLKAGAQVNHLTGSIAQADRMVQDELKLRTAASAAGATAAPTPASVKGKSSTPDSGASEQPAGRGERDSGTSPEKTEEESAGKPRPPRNADEAVDQVRIAYRKLNDEVSGDIVHRLERAEYYIAQFEKTASALRVRRIEGFQQYNEMVSRRMSGIFGYISLMRIRMRDVDARMSALARAYASLKTVETTDNIKSLVKSMKDQDKKIEQIQEFGEIALIGVLIPYYLGVALFHYTFHLEGAAALQAWRILLSLFAAVVIYRSVRRHWMEREDNTFGLIGLAFTIHLLFLWFALPALLPHAPDP